MHKPFIIGVGGAHSSVGKTTLSAALIRQFATGRHSDCFKMLPAQPVIGAIKYTKTDLYASLVDDEAIIAEKDKDTSKLSAAGAGKVLWIKSPKSGIEELVSVALSRLADADIIVIEGNSAIEFAKPDIVIFIIGTPEEGIKPSAEMLAGEADIIITLKPAADAALPAGTSAKICALDRYPYAFDDNEIFNIITLMDNISSTKEIKRLLTERAVDARLTCTAARKIAEELGVPYIEVGRAANELKIKIKNCELGCF